VPALETELRQPQLGRGQAGREDDVALVLKACLQLPYPGSGTGDPLVEEQHIVMMRRRGLHSATAIRGLQTLQRSANAFSTRRSRGSRSNAFW
jgi:hypothetical protein